MAANLPFSSGFGVFKKGFHLGVILTMAIWILFCPPVFSDEPPGETPMKTGGPDGFEDGFDDVDPFASVDEETEGGVLENTPDSDSKPSKLHIGGFVELDTQIRLNASHDNVSVFKPQVFLETEYRFNSDHKFRASGLAFYDAAYDIRNRPKKDPQRLDDENRDIELRDFYLDSNLNNLFSVRAGRQIITWGDSNWARITDVVNPRDLTQPGIIDLEDARLPVAALRLTMAGETFSFEGVTLHEHPGSKLAGKDSDFDYYASLRQADIFITGKDTPDAGYTGFAVKATRSFNGGDISFMGAHTFDQQPLLAYQGTNDEGTTVFTPEYQRFTTFGFSGSLVRDSTLFKLETAYYNDRAIQQNDVLAKIGAGIPGGSVPFFRRQDQADGLIGVEYSGVDDLLLLLEGRIIYTLDHQSYLNTSEYEYRSYAQATYEMLHNTLVFDLFWAWFNPGDGHILRLSGEYEIQDNVSVKSGFAFYDAKDSDAAIYPYREMDRVFFKFKYSF